MSSETATLAKVADHAQQTVEYVQRALGLELTYDSETLPLLDHYLRTVPADLPPTVALVLATAGAYFGEVVRRHLGGRWELGTSDATEWRLILPTGFSFVPAGMVAAAILRSDDIEDVETEFDCPAGARPYLEEALDRMADVTEDDYYSLCGRLDTFEHLQAVLLAVAEQLRAQQN